jgi:DNA-binding beta-propeller fold protein YncE
LREPGGIAFDSAGNLYVTDVANRRVQKLKPDGTFMAEWKGPDPGFYGPRDLFVGRDNSVYVVDQGHSRVVKFDANGGIAAVWGTPGTGDGQFREPTAIAVDEKNERVYVADPRNQRIAVFDPNGKFIAKWLVTEWGAQAAWYFQDLAIDSINGLLYASSNATDEVLVFTLSGNKIKSLKADPPDKVTGASAIALAKNSLYVINTFSARVSRIELETK